MKNISEILLPLVDSNSQLQVNKRLMIIKDFILEVNNNKVPVSLEEIILIKFNLLKLEYQLQSMTSKSHKAMKHINEALSSLLVNRTGDLLVPAKIYNNQLVTINDRGVLFIDHKVIGKSEIISMYPELNT